MKKIFLVIGLIIVVILFSIPVTVNKSTQITTDIYKIALHLQDPKNWIQWNKDIKDVYEENSAKVNIKQDVAANRFIIQIPNRDFQVERVNSLAYKIKETTPKHSSTYILNIIPVNENLVRVVVEKQISLLYYFFHFLKPSSEEVSVNNLKLFLEAPNSFYGFNVEIKKVVNSVFATKRFKVKSKEVFTSLPPSFAKVEQYIANNKLSIVDKKAVSYSIINRDSAQIMVGIPVNTSAAPRDSITCLILPKQSRIVAAYYEGKFANRQDVYNAVDKYILEHNLHKASLPFEEYVDNVLPASESAQVKFILHYPISD